MRTGPGEVSHGFDFTRHMRLLCSDMTQRLRELAHIDLTRVAVTFSQARRASPYGVQASLTPMRFAGGSRVTKRRGRYYTSQRLLDPDGREMLYILTFCLPRFMDIAFREKLATVLHELWHISPRFDGDIRRIDGRCFLHSGSQRRYDHAMEVLAERWLRLDPPPSIYQFLHWRFVDLQRLYGRVCGVKMRRPKLIPIPAAQAHKIPPGRGPRDLDADSPAP